MAKVFHRRKPKDKNPEQNIKINIVVSRSAGETEHVGSWCLSTLFSPFPAALNSPLRRPKRETSLPRYRSWRI